MRMSEILTESVMGASDVIDEMITSFVSLGKTTIDTNKLLNHMAINMGIDLDVDSLIRILDEHPMVISANEKLITVGDAASSDPKPADGNEQDRVSQMADGAANLGD